MCYRSALTSWESGVIRCRLLQFWTTLLSGHQRACRSVLSGLGASFRCVTWIQESILWSSVASGLVRSSWWKSFPARLKRAFLEMSFPTDEISGLRGVRLTVIISRSVPREDAVPKYRYFNEAVRPLQYWCVSPFVNWGSEEAGAKCMGRPVTTSKGESLRVPERVELRFRTNGSAFGRRSWKISSDFANWVLIVPLVCSTDAEDWGWYAQGKRLGNQPTARTCWSTWLAKRVLWSLCSLRGVPQVGIIFSNGILATEAALACLQVKALHQWETNKPWLKHLYPREREAVWNPLVQTGFPGLYFRQVGQER